MPRRPAALLVALGVVLGLVGIAQAGYPTKMDKPRDRGRALYREGCWGCHGWTGEGGGPTAALLKTSAPPLAGRYTEDQFESVATIILNGRGEMPGYSQVMDRADAKRVLAWLSALDRDNPVDEGPKPEKDEDEEAAEEEGGPAPAGD